MKELNARNMKAKYINNIYEGSDHPKNDLTLR